MLQTLNQYSGLIALAALLVAAGALALVKSLQARVEAVTPDMRALIRGLKGKDVPEALQETFSHVQAMSSRLTRTEARAAVLDEQYTRTVQKVGLVRFNYDDSIRGDLSFALALLDAHDNGVILASLYSLDTCRVFIRAVEAGKTQHDLIPEERQALTKATSAPGDSPE